MINKRHKKTNENIEDVKSFKEFDNEYGFDVNKDGFKYEEEPDFNFDEEDDLEDYDDVESEIIDRDFSYDDRDEHTRDNDLDYEDEDGYEDDFQQLEQDRIDDEDNFTESKFVTSINEFKQLFNKKNRLVESYDKFTDDYVLTKANVQTLYTLVEDDLGPDETSTDEEYQEFMKEYTGKTLAEYAKHIWPDNYKEQLRMAKEILNDNKINESVERETTGFEQDVFLFLNDLRDSGETNMFGAGSYIVDEFDIDKREASKLLSLWMDNFNEEGNYDIIKEHSIPDEEYVFDGDNDTCECINGECICDESTGERHHLLNKTGWDKAQDKIANESHSSQKFTDYDSEDSLDEAFEKLKYYIIEHGVDDMFFSIFDTNKSYTEKVHELIDFLSNYVNREGFITYAGSYFNTSFYNNEDFTEFAEYLLGLDNQFPTNESFSLTIKDFSKKNKK